MDDVKEIVLKERASCYPILDEGEKIAGLLYQNHLLRPRRKRVVLVDHNERAQSVPGLEEAQILEIIDHHRLADIETGNPIYVRNEPVGSTATIVADMYQEKGLMPTAKMAGLIAAAIVSDTMADAISPAIFSEGMRPRSWNMLATMVVVEPTGSFRT